MITKLRIHGFPVEIDMQNRRGVRWWAEIREQLRRQASALYESVIHAHGAGASRSEAPIAQNIDDHYQSPASSDACDHQGPMSVNPLIPAHSVSYQQEIDLSLENLEWSIEGGGLNPTTRGNHFLPSYT